MLFSKINLLASFFDQNIFSRVQISKIMYNAINWNDRFWWQNVSIMKTFHSVAMHFVFHWLIIMSMSNANVCCRCLLQYYVRTTIDMKELA